MFDPHNNYRQVEVRDNRMSYQEPKSRTTLSTTAKVDNHMSCQEPKPRTTPSATTKNDNHMSCQEPKPRTTPSATTKNDNPMSCQEPKPRTTPSATTKNDNRMSFQEPKPRTTPSATTKNDNRMSFQEPKPRTTPSATTKNDNRMSFQEPKPRTTPSATTKNDNRMSFQEPKPRITSSAAAKNDNSMSCQEPKPRTTSSTTAKNDNYMSCQEPKSRTTLSKTVILRDLMLIIAIIGIGLHSVITEPPHAQDPKPTQWPDQFHSRIVMNNSGVIELVDFWYDWTNGRSFNIIQRQGGSVLYDLECNYGTSFHYTVGSYGTCSSSYMEGGGILKPDWLDRMSYVGQREVDGSLCNVWENPEFITYYEDAVTKRPVHWALYTGKEAHVMTFEVGAALEDEKWEVPSYCFEQTDAAELGPMNVGAITHRGLVDSGTRKVKDTQK